MSTTPSLDSRVIYLDFNASTPLAPEVVRAMEPYLEGRFGNPSASHWASSEAKRGLHAAREQVAKRIGCEASAIVFTSGGTESNNHAILGAFYRSRLRDEPFHVVTSVVEHPSVLEAVQFVKRLGAEASHVPVDRFGRVDPDDVRKSLRPDTRLVSIMHANNEVGTLQPIEAIGRLAREHGVLFHTDAAQSLGKVPVDVDALSVDLLTIAGHKCYAPKGVGALFMRDGIEVEPLLHGGGHESGHRSGTENVLLIAALGAACELSDPAAMRGVAALRERLHDALRTKFDGELALNGHPEQRLPNTLNVSFVGKDAPRALGGIEAFAASTGSACHSDVREMSPVLKAMGVSEDVGFGAVRLSLGRSSTEADIDTAAERLLDAFGRIE